MKRIPTICAGSGLLLVLCAGTQLALVQVLSVVEEFPVVDQGPQMHGWVETTGTHFETKDTEHLNIILDSTEEIRLTWESVPEMVNMFIESTSSASSTVMSLSGFSPMTTYYKYEDDFHNLEAFTTDGDGNHSYVQDISTPHLVIIQSNPSTKFIPGDISIGTWDPVNRIFTLTTDVSGTIQIDRDNLTLNGAGHTVTGPGWGNGVYLSRRTGVTVENLDVKRFTYAIYLYSSSDITLTGNTVSYNNLNQGIYLLSSDDNTLTDNTVRNYRLGISLYSSNGNTLTDNTLTGDSHGIFLFSSNGNTLTGNTANWNRRSGINIQRSNNNTLTGNSSYSNNDHGIVFSLSSNNALTGNTLSNNGILTPSSGIHLGSSSNSNILTGNTFSKNRRAP